MKTSPITVIIPKDLNDALQTLADDKFGGNKSNAIRFLLVQGLATRNKSDFNAMYALYINFMPEFTKTMNFVVSHVEEELKKRLFGTKQT